MDPAASLEALERKRKQLWAQLEALGDVRRGGISANYRKCGKANCRCARPNHPGHGPQYLWNATIGGQSRACNVPLGPELQKVGREVGAYRRFVRLCQKLVEVNEQICDLRPLEELQEEALDVLKKIAQEVLAEAEAEIEHLVGRVLKEGQRRGQLDLEAGEQMVRDAMHP